MKSKHHEKKPAEAVGIADRLCLDEREAAAYLGISISFLRQGRIGLRHGPVVTRFGRAVRYQKPHLNAFAEENREAAPCEKGARIEAQAAQAAATAS